MNELEKYQANLTALLYSPFTPQEKLEWIKRELLKVERRLKYEVENE